MLARGKLFGDFANWLATSSLYALDDFSFATSTLCSRGFVSVEVLIVFNFLV